MPVIVGLACAISPVGITALLIYIFIVNHQELIDKIYIKITIFGIGVSLIVSPLILAAYLLIGFELQESSVIALGMFTFIDVAICALILYSVLSKAIPERKYKNKCRHKYNDTNITWVNTVNILGVAYKDDTLYIFLRDKTAFLYLDVPENIYEEIKSTKDIDRYYDDNISRRYKRIELSL